SYIESLENRLRRMESLLENINSSTNLETQNEKLITEVQTTNEKSKIVRYLGSSSGYYLVKNILTTDDQDMAEVKEDQQRRASLQDDNVSSFRFRNINVDNDDIMYVRDTTLAERVDQLQADRLDFKEDIAPKAFIDKLVARFFEINYISFPVIDREPFLNAYHGHTQPPPPPILIYAICVHACLLVPKNDTLFDDACINRKEFFETLSIHASNLIKKEYLNPRLATIQALVLLSGAPACGKTLYKNWLRVGMAVRMAQELGLHRTHDKLPLTEEMFEANKRLWYCVYIADRWCCAVMGRPLAIADADCDIDLPHVNGGIQGNKDYSLFVDFVKLSGILGEVLRRIYSPRAKHQGYKKITAYHTVQMWPELHDQAGYRCTEAAKHTIDIARLLSPSDVVHFGFNFAGFSVFQASLIHVYNCINSNPEIANTAKQYVQICIDECIEPINGLINPPTHAAALIKTLLNLIGAEKQENAKEKSCRKDNVYSELKTNNLNKNRFVQPSSYTSPMSVNAIISDWENRTSDNSYQTYVPLANNNSSGSSNVVSTVAWQSLFASAATQLFDNDVDWETTLSTLFDDNQLKQQNRNDYEEQQEHSSYYNQSSQTMHHTSSYSSSYHHSSNRNDGGDDNDPSFTEEDYQHPNPNFEQPPNSHHNPGPHPVAKDDDELEFELSNCQGKKRALLIGINYIGTSSELNGKYMEKEDMVILTDDQEEEKFKPTRANIISAMQWLVHDAEADDSGHGGRIEDVHHDEDDSFDETIYPLDFEQFEGTSGQIIDDDLHDLLVRPLPPKCRLTAIFDSCHSGTVLDLPYVYSTQGEIKEQNLFKYAGKGFLSAGIAYAQGDKEGALASIMSLGKQLMEARDVSDRVRRKNASQADVIMFSGCKDDQTSADANEAGRATGAMSYAFTSKI
ncbi:caspase domain-containing protein, partial [Blakeslea trispora]